MTAAPTRETLTEVLAAPVEQPNHVEATTVREYLAAIIQLIWQDPLGNESGKRLDGDSSWRDLVYKALHKAGLVDATLDEDGYFEKLDTNGADALIVAATREMALGR